MKNLIFIGHDNVGDALLSYQILDSLSHQIPEIKIFIYNKNSKNSSVFFKNHSNIQSINTISTKIFSKKIFTDTIALYKKINTLLQSNDVYITSLLGSSTIKILLSLLIFYNFLLRKHKIHILQLNPILSKMKEHILDFHRKQFTTICGKKINIVQNNNIFPIIKTLHKQKTISIVAGASGMWKTYPAKHFVEIIKHFSEKGYHIKLLGSASAVDISQAEEIIKILPNHFQIENFVGKTTLQEYFSQITNSDYIITNDSSAQHICNYLGTPCAVIWGRHPHDPVVKAYSWNNEKTANIFPENYKFTQLYWFSYKLFNKHLGRDKHALSMNFNNISPQKVIAVVENHIHNLSKNSDR